MRILNCFNSGFNDRDVHGGDGGHENHDEDQGVEGVKMGNMMMIINSIWSRGGGDGQGIVHHPSLSVINLHRCPVPWPVHRQRTNSLGLHAAGKCDPFLII